MATTAAQKLKIKEGWSLLTINAPADFKNDLGDLPAHVTISAKAKEFQQVHWFVKDKAQMDEELTKVLALLKDNVTIWIYFPKGSSKIQTDLTRDKGWEALLQHKNLQWLNLVSFNDTWSAFAMRLKTEKDRKKEAAPKERAVFQYIDAVKKQVFLPDDFSRAMNDTPTATAFFETPSFTNKKEYLEWIVSAKREETRTSRVNESVNRLVKGWKNPANR